MKERIEKLIRDGGARIAFDTNAMWNHLRFFEVCNLANRLRDAQPQLDFQLLVPAIAHGEHVLHIRHENRKKDRAFDVSRLRKDLERKRLNVQTFDAQDAEGVAELIAAQYSDDQSWQESKKELAIRKLGLPTATASDAPGKKLPATVDWLIAGQAKNNNWILVTNDQGVEFKDLERIDLESLEMLLSRLLTSAAEAAG